MSEFEDDMSKPEDDPGPCVCTDCQDAREQAVSETEPLAGTSSYTGVIRSADEADECAHTALSLIYRRERDEARCQLDAILAVNRQLSAAKDATIERLWAQLNEATNTPHNDPEFGFDKTAALSDPGEEGVSESVAQHVCDCPRHVAYRENLAANTTTPMCLVHPDHFMPCLRCLGYGCTACDRGVQAADDRRSL